MNSEYYILLTNRIHRCTLDLGSCNSCNHGQTVHRTKKNISMNLLLRDNMDSKKIQPLTSEKRLRPYYFFKSKFYVWFNNQIEKGKCISNNKRSINAHVICKHQNTTFLNYSTIKQLLQFEDSTGFFYYSLLSCNH